MDSCPSDPRWASYDSGLQNITMTQISRRFFSHLRGQTMSFGLCSTTGETETRPRGLKPSSFVKTWRRTLVSQTTAATKRQQWEHGPAKKGLVVSPYCAPFFLHVSPTQSLRYRVLEVEKLHPTRGLGPAKWISFTSTSFGSLYVFCIVFCIVEA